MAVSCNTNHSFVNNASHIATYKLGSDFPGLMPNSAKQCLILVTQMQPGPQLY